MWPASDAFEFEKVKAGKKEKRMCLILFSLDFSCHTVWHEKSGDMFCTYDCTEYVLFASSGQVLCLDECTANVDPSTGAKVLEIIQSLARPHEDKGHGPHQASGTMTVLSIAHRVTTLLASQRVLVVEEGRVVEDGNPKDLLEQVGSAFRALAIS